MKEEQFFIRGLVILIVMSFLILWLGTLVPAS